MKSQQWTEQKIFFYIIELKNSWWLVMNGNIFSGVEFYGFLERDGVNFHTIFETLKITQYLNFPKKNPIDPPLKKNLN
jgi:hypothetical protein